jgi:hypothetical protein
MADDATTVIDKAIKSLGGEEALGKAKAATWKTKGTITFGGNDNEVTSTFTMQGLDRFRQEFEGEFNGMKVKGVTVLDGEKGSRKFGDMGGELDKEAISQTKRTLYLNVIPITILPLKGKEFKVESIPDATVDGKPAAGIKVTGPDMKDFKLYFDKESGLPVKQEAKVAGFMGGEFTQVTTYAEYKEFSGIKKATKVKATRDGEKFMDQQVVEFKVLDKVDPKVFTEGA